MRTRKILFLGRCSDKEARGGWAGQYRRRPDRGICGARCDISIRRVNTIGSDVYEPYTRLEHGRIRNPYGQVGEHGQGLVREDARESEIMCDLVDSEE